jgi:hypothetical protein
MLQVRAQVESQVDAMLAEFNAEKALKEKEKGETGNKDERGKEEEKRKAGEAASPAPEAGGGAAAEAAATEAGGEKKAEMEPKRAQHPEAMRGTHEAAKVESKPGAAAAENTSAPARAPGGGKGSEGSRSRSASDASSVGLSELLRESDKHSRDSDAGASGAFPDEGDEEEEEEDIKLPSPKISISADPGAEKGQGQAGRGGEEDDNSEPPSLPTSMQSTPKAASTRGMSVDDILHPSQALALGGQTAKDLRGLDKLLAKAAPSQEGGKDEESDWDLDMSSQVRACATVCRIYCVLSIECRRLACRTSLVPPACLASQVCAWSALRQAAPSRTRSCR